MEIEIFTLKALAERQQVTYGYLRKLTSRLNKGEDVVWKGFRFFGKPKKYWFAYPADHMVIFQTASKEGSPDTEPANNEEKPDAETPTVDAPDADASHPVSQAED